MPSRPTMTGGPSQAQLMLSLSVEAPSVVEIPLLVASMAGLSLSHSVGFVVEDFPPLKDAPSSGISDDATRVVGSSITSVATESQSQSQQLVGARALQDGWKELGGVLLLHPPLAFSPTFPCPWSQSPFPPHPPITIHGWMGRKPLNYLL